LATHDLEIRGAGELLGEDQSGSMSQVGFSLYMEMLDHAVEALKDGKQLSLTQVTAKQTEIELRLPALIPESYIFDVSIRLSLYKRIASCKNKNQLDDIQVELIDRFGLLPQATKNLIQIAKIRLKAQTIGISRIEVNEKGGSVEFNDDTSVDHMLIIALVQKQPTTYKMVPPNKLKFSRASEGEQARFSLITTLLNDLTTAK